MADGFLLLLLRKTFCLCTLVLCVGDADPTTECNSHRDAPDEVSVVARCTLHSDQTGTQIRYFTGFECSCKLNCEYFMSQMAFERCSFRRLLAGEFVPRVCVMCYNRMHTVHTCAVHKHRHTCWANMYVQYSVTTKLFRYSLRKTVWHYADAQQTSTEPHYDGSHVLRVCGSNGCWWPTTTATVQNYCACGCQTICGPDGSGKWNECYMSNRRRVRARAIENYECM